MAYGDIRDVPTLRLLVVVRMGMPGRSNGVEFSPEQARKELEDRAVLRPLAKALRLRVPCHYPKCKALSRPVSNYCSKHGRVMRTKYESQLEGL